MPVENPFVLALVIAGVLILFGFVMLLVRRYKRCPSNKILVIYGKVKEGQSAKCLHGGGAFVWPLIQDYEYLSLDPIQIEIPLKGALSMENIRVNVPSVFTVAVGTDAATMQNAAVRLLGLKIADIVKQSEDIIFGQLRQVIASMKIEDINRDRDKFLDSVQSSLEPELQKIGLVLINVNITDITDQSGYIEAIGRKAASEAIKQAEIDVAEQVKRGAIGVAEAEKEKLISVANAVKFQEIGTKEATREMAVRVAELDKERAIGEQTAAFQQMAQVKEAERQMRVAVAEANATAVTGENLSKARIADTNAALRVKEAEAFQLGETRHREADAAVREAQYLAEARAAAALAAKIEAEKRAELEAVAKAAKAKQIVDAEAAAEQKKLEANAEAAAIYAKLEARARGEFEILAKKGEGLRQIVAGCGSPQAAFQMLLLEHLEKLSETAAGAIANIKFDKVVVWDGGNGKGGTANFLQSLTHALPPMLNIMKDVGGIEMPAFFGKLMPDESGTGSGPNPPESPRTVSGPKPPDSPGR
jgi:flotillin